MKLTEREKWLYYLTVLKTSQTGKILSLEQKQAISEFIKTKIYPKITYDEWREMEVDMIKMNTQIMDLMWEGMQTSIGGKLPREVEQMFKVEDIAKLDNSVRDSLSTIDFEKLQGVFNQLPEKQRKELAPMFKKVKDISEQYKKEKKNG